MSDDGSRRALLRIPPSDGRCVAFAGALAEASASAVVLDGVTHGARTTDLPSLLGAVDAPARLEATASGDAILAADLSGETWIVRGAPYLLAMIAEVLSSAGCPVTGPDPDHPA